MITLLSKIFIPKELNENEKRGAYGVLCGVVGILLNSLLFVGKFFAGLISGSIAITADAFNNLSDAGSSVVTLVGFKLAGHKPDSEHPFGHGRMEYLAGLGVSAMIIVMAVELIRDSIDKILHPAETEFSPLILGILIASILVKVYMAFYNTRVGKKLNSATIKAVATDSLSDCVTTSIVIVSLLVQQYSGLKIDGYCGVVVGVLIFAAGIGAAKDTINPLLGTPPSEEFVKQIEDITLHFDERVVGIHDLIVHDYGPGRKFISLHAEVPEEGNIVELHEVIDQLEKHLGETLDCMVTIHMDPIATQDEFVAGLKKRVAHIVKIMDENMAIHDFRVVRGEKQTNLIFDVVVPYQVKKTDVQLKEQLQGAVHELIGPEYAIVIQVDRAYVL